MTIETAKYIVYRSGSKQVCTGNKVSDNVRDTDKMLVSRNGGWGQVQGSQLDTHIRDTDYVICYDADGKWKKVTGKNFKTLIKKDIYYVAVKHLDDGAPYKIAMQGLLLVNWGNNVVVGHTDGSYGELAINTSDNNGHTWIKPGMGDIPTNQQGQHTTSLSHRVGSNVVLATRGTSSIRNTISLDGGKNFKLADTRTDGKRFHVAGDFNPSVYSPGYTCLTKNSAVIVQRDMANNGNNYDCYATDANITSWTPSQFNSGPSGPIFVENVTYSYKYNRVFTSSTAGMYGYNAANGRYISNDEGKTWNFQAESNVIAMSYIETVTDGNDEMIFGTDLTNKIIWKSTDGGLNWSNFNANPDLVTNVCNSGNVSRGPVKVPGKKILAWRTVPGANNNNFTYFTDYNGNYISDPYFAKWTTDSGAKFTNGANFVGGDGRLYVLCASLRTSGVGETTHAWLLIDDNWLGDITP